MKSLIKKILFKYPRLKQLIKNAYQFVGTVFSNKKTVPKNIRRISNLKHEHIFGYYDKSPWSNDGKKFIYQRVYKASKKTSSTEKSEIILKNMQTNEERIITYTNAWNVQQGSMLQWFGSGFQNQIIFNDFRDNHFCSIIYNVESDEEKIINFPIYSVGKSGKIGLTLDFSRLNSLRPGYGYSNIIDKTHDIKLPEEAISLIDFEFNEKKPLIYYNKLIQLNYKNSMKNAYHKVNHIMLSPDENKFLFLHRWIDKGRKYDRLLISDINAREIEILLDDGMVSHYNWLDEKRIIVWANTLSEGTHYYIIDVVTKERTVFMGEFLKSDGHPSISPDGKYIITDTYPNFNRKQKIYLCKINENTCEKIASIYASYKYKNEKRCDLHPRWHPNSIEICFDGTQEGIRQVYTMSIEEVTNK